MLQSSNRSGWRVATVVVLEALFILQVETIGEPREYCHGYLVGEGDVILQQRPT